MSVEKCSRCKTENQPLFKAEPKRKGCRLSPLTLCPRCCNRTGLKPILSGQELHKFAAHLAEVAGVA